MAQVITLADLLKWKTEEIQNFARELEVHPSDFFKLVDDMVKVILRPLGIPGRIGFRNAEEEGDFFYSKMDKLVVLTILRATPLRVMTIEVIDDFPKLTKLLDALNYFAVSNPYVRELEADFSQARQNLMNGVLSVIENRFHFGLATPRLLNTLKI